MEEASQRKRVREDSSEFELDSSKAKKIKDDLLSLLDDSDTVSDRDDPASQDLDSVIRSFEEEISGFAPSSSLTSDKLTSDSGEDLPDLLGEFVEHELGLPAAVADTSEIGELWEFHEGIPSYDSFEFGIGHVANSNTADSHGSEYVALDGIFDNPDIYLGSDIGWRPETLPAL